MNRLGPIEHRTRASAVSVPGELDRLDRIGARLASRRRRFAGGDQR